MVQQKTNTLSQLPCFDAGLIFGVACEVNLWIRFDLLLLGEMPAHSHRNLLQVSGHPVLWTLSVWAFRLLRKFATSTYPDPSSVLFTNDQCTMIIIFRTIQVTELTVHLTEVAVSSYHMNMVRSKLFQKYGPCTIIVISCLL